MAGDSSNAGEPGGEGLGPTSLSHPAKLLGQNRQFLDFFWDIAKPDQEIRLKATEGLLGYLRENQKDDELLKYTLKRLIDGLGATREAARPGFSLALAQLLQVYEELPLLTVLEQIKDKYNLGKVKKKLFRNALFGNFFGVLALFQSGRLSKDSKALPECVQLLQSLSEHYNHLKDLPRKTLADIISEIPEAVFEEVLFGILEDDLTSAFSTPGQLYLLLVGIQKFPRVLQPEKLKTLLGTTAVVTKENIPRLLEVLKMAAKSEKKDRTLPTVALDLMKVALKEGAFELFWDEAVENGLLKDNIGPCSYMCYRLLGSSLPLLSLSQLRMILRGEVMRQYGIHVVSTQLPDRFKFAPEMEAYVSSFLEGCKNPEKQLAVVVGFSVLTNQGYPVVPTFWKVVSHLLPDALLKYIDWLKGMYLNPDLDSCLDFATKRQQQNEKKGDGEMVGHCVTRLRKWIIARLVGIVENPQIKKEEEFVTDIARFCFFHAFFKTKKPTSEIPETEATPSVPLNEPSCTAAANSFFSLLQHLNTMPAVGDSVQAEEMRKKHVHGLTTSGVSWLYLVAQYANLLLSRQKHVTVVAPFSEEQLSAWKRMLETVETLRGREQTDHNVKSSAFQHLLLLVGIHLFKSADECVNLLGDLQKCAQKAFGEKPRKKKSVAAGGEEEPDWVEVIVEVLLSLLTHSSGLIRRVCKSVFGLVCQHMTKRALQLILDVLDPQQDQDEDNALVVVEETKKTKSLPENASGDLSSGENSSDEDSSEEDGDSDGNEKEGESDDEHGTVDENFRAMLRNVLQAGNALGGEDSDEEVDDKTMMSLDKNLSALFAEQQKRIQAKKDEKEKMKKEKFLRREFKIKVLDLVEVFLTKQAENPLVFSLIDPLLSVIEQSMSSESNKQEQDYLQKTADIFRNHLCRSRQYCKNVAPMREELHAHLESLVRRACKQSDSSVALYCFSASLYLFRVLKGNVVVEDTSQVVQPKKKRKGSEKNDSSPCQPPSLGSLDLERVSAVYKEALNLFLTKRKSPLTGSMFLDLFERHPIMYKQLIDVVVKSITGGARQHQQAQACLLLQKALQTKDFRLLLSEHEWEALIRESISQVTETLKGVSEIKVKVDQEKIITCLDLLNNLIKMVFQQKLDVDLTELRSRLESWAENEGFRKSTRLEDIYWNVMKLFGFTRPAKEKAPTQAKSQAEAEPLRKKKKGFLPATKKRKNRKKVLLEQPQQNGAESGSKGGDADEASQNPEGKKKRKRKRKRKQGGETQSSGQAPSPAKKAMQSPGDAQEADTQQRAGHKKKRRKRKGKRAKTLPAQGGTD